MKSAFGLPKKREAVVQALQKAYTDGDLEEWEYENRLSNAYEAKTLEELKEILHDFPPHVISNIFPTERIPQNFSRAPYHNTSQVPASYSSSVRKVIMSEAAHPLTVITERPARFSNLMGTLRINTDHAQIQTNRCQINVDCWLGNTKINLLNPELAGKEVHVYIHGGLGEINIYVPPGTHVSRPIQLIMGEFSHRKRNALLHMFNKDKNVDFDGMAFHLIIHGNFIMGSIRVRY